MADMIRAERLQDGQLDQIIPELTPLKSAIEINDVHDHQSVFDHTVAVVRGLEQLLSDQTYAPLMAQKRGNRSRQDLLLIAAALHDIGKPIVLTPDPATQQTSCPTHEVIGAKIAARIVNRLGIDRAAARHIERIVRLHQEIHTALVKSRTGESAVLFRDLHRKSGDVYPELLLLGLADIRGSDLQRLQPGEFERQEARIVQHITQFFAS